MESRERAEDDEKSNTGLITPMRLLQFKRPHRRLSVLARSMGPTVVGLTPREAGLPVRTTIYRYGWLDGHDTHHVRPLGLDRNLGRCC